MQKYINEDAKLKQRHTVKPNLKGNERLTIVPPKSSKISVQAFKMTFYLLVCTSFYFRRVNESVRGKETYRRATIGVGVVGLKALVTKPPNQKKNFK